MRLSVLLICALASTVVNVSDIHAQWVQTNGPYAGFITSFGAHDSTLFASTEGAGVYVSTDNAVTWREMNIGIADLWVNDLLIVDTDLFASTYDSIYRTSTRSGIWESLGRLNSTVSAFAAVTGNVFAATNTGVFRSVDRGASWNIVNFGLPTDIRSYGGPPDTMIAPTVTLTTLGLNLFVGTRNHGVYISTNNGDSWQLGTLAFKTLMSHFLVL
jgi:hypothetical protein